MKIVFITTLYPDSKEQSLTKVPYALHYFVQNWVKQNHEIQVIKVEATYPKYLPQYYNTNRMRRERDVTIDGINVHVIQVKKNINRHFSKISAKSVAAKAIEYLIGKNTQYDAVIFHVFEPSYYIADELRRKLSIPIIWGFHQSDINWIKAAKNTRILDDNIRNISAIAFRSNSLKTAFKKHYDYEIQSFIIPSGIPNNIISNLRTEEAFDNMQFITVANMIKRKNLDIVIEAFSKLHKNSKNITLRIIGSGEELNKLKALTSQLEIKDSVLFLGYCDREKVFEELKHSHVFVLPSVDETFGMVYLEAMSQGCIPIGTIGEGIDGIIVDGKNGYLCTPNVDSCYYKMNTAMKLRAKDIEAIKKEIYKTVQKYTDEKCAQNYASRIQEIVKN